MYAIPTPIAIRGSNISNSGKVAVLTSCSTMCCSINQKEICSLTEITALLSSGHYEYMIDSLPVLAALKIYLYVSLRGLRYGLRDGKT